MAESAATLGLTKDGLRNQTDRLQTEVSPSGLADATVFGNFFSALLYCCLMPLRGK
ncbi:MAG: hypothetical protein LBT47_14375 [Deltaproteobacteria bacterium]|nr:hypothetical protein [Deltaproteobacteria bacterium]